MPQGAQPATEEKKSAGDLQFHTAATMTYTGAVGDDPETGFQGKGVESVRKRREKSNLQRKKQQILMGPFSNFRKK